MPWFRTLFLGIAMLIACACGGAPATGHPPSPSPSPSPTRVPTPVATASLGTGYAPWPLNLDLSGDLTGHASGTAVPDDLIKDECTGSGSASQGKWASTMAITVSGQRYALVILVDNYKGPDTFTTNVSVEVHSPDKAKVWQTRADDHVSVRVDTTEVTGLLDATLSNAATPTSKLKIYGNWSCHP